MTAALTTTQAIARDLQRLAACLVASKSSDRFQADERGYQASNWHVLSGGEPVAVHRWDAHRWIERGWVELERTTWVARYVRRMTYRVTEWGHEALEREANRG